VHFAENHELARAADVSDEYGFGADESRGGRITLEESPLLLGHGRFLPYPGPAMM
jgi:hypothetical protein